MKLSDYRKELTQQDSELAVRLERDISHQIGKMIVRARLLRGVTQEGLAKLAETQQPSIARMESGSSVPSLSFLKKVVEAMGYTLLPPRIAELEELDSIHINRDSGLYRHDVTGWGDLIPSPVGVRTVSLY